MQQHTREHDEGILAMHLRLIFFTQALY